MYEFTRLMKKIIMRGLLFPLRIFGIKSNRIVLLNDLSKKFADNPKAVALYLVEHYPNTFDIIFPVNDVTETSKYATQGIKFIKFHSFKYFFYAMTAAVFLTNSGGFSFIPMRRKQFIINTFHGGGAYKKCGIYMYSNSWFFRQDLRLSSDNTNIFMSTCKRFSDVISISLLVPRNIFLEVGMPRNDCLININQKRQDEIRKTIGLQPDEKLVLFAPTYRKPNNNHFLDSIAIPYGLDCSRVLRALEQRFGGKWKFAVRLHPTVVNRKDFVFDNVMDLSDYDDMQEPLMVTDVLITDFSSSIWDFLLTGRPTFIFAEDLDHYIKTTEVYTPVEEWPFSRARDNSEIERNILQFNKAEYIKNCKRHYDELGGCETGRATEIICQYIYDACYRNK